jgi:16S rRNA (cytosine1402-N4)-methyltransferase
MLNTAMKIDQDDIRHNSVMADEVGKCLQPREGGTYLDATLGFGGHTYEILKRSNFNSHVVAMDVDKDAIEYSEQFLSDYKENVTFIHRNFVEVDKVINTLGIEKLDGIVADLGMSSYQIDRSGRGFSFLKNEFLDMRMGEDIKYTAYDLVNNSSFDELSKMFSEYGEEQFAKRISADIVRRREIKEIRLTSELADLVESSIPKKFHPRYIHPATKVFQALRIAVNSELTNLAVFIGKASTLLNSKSRIAIISFHSLEDRIVKNTFRSLCETCICPPGMPVCGCGKKQMLKLITRRPISPSSSEIINNRRSRSARLRVAEKI